MSDDLITMYGVDHVTCQFNIQGSEDLEELVSLLGDNVPEEVPEYLRECFQQYGPETYSLNYYSGWDRAGDMKVFSFRPMLSRPLTVKDFRTALEEISEIVDKYQAPFIAFDKLKHSKGDFSKLSKEEGASIEGMDTEALNCALAIKASVLDSTLYSISMSENDPEDLRMFYDKWVNYASHN